MKKTLISMIVAVTIVSVAFGQEKRYAIESAIVKKNMVVKMQGMEQNLTSVQYFADYGGKESIEMVMNVQGQSFTIFTLMKDGYVYSANLAMGQGTKINLAEMDDYKNVNFLNLTDEIKQKYQIQANGVEQVAGKPCNRYEMSFTTQGQSVKATVWVWQGLTLKSKMNMAGTNAEEEATEIQEGVKIAAEKFELPAGVNFTEVKP
jgi:hypothetical protein